MSLAAQIKNEFMSNWDGLRTSNSDRVLVLAATNRPGDLDDAVVRRLPRRLLVDLPDAPNRARILKVCPPPHLGAPALPQILTLFCGGTCKSDKILLIDVTAELVIGRGLWSV